MRNLSSGNEIRWWFRSRHAGRLNSLSYWLCVLFFSVLLSLVFSALWQRTRSASENSDWVYGTPPNALIAYRSAFLEKRKVLISRVRFGDQSQNAKNIPLCSAQDIKDYKNSDSNPLCNPPLQEGSMFDKYPDIRVYPSFATFSKKNQELTADEKEVFNRFAAVATTLYSGQKNNDSNHIERTLATALGLSDPIDVPWIYVASKEGAIAVFPGTTVISEDRWNITSRPWYMAALGGDAQLLSNGLVEDDRLTATYLDVLAKRPMLVRTYMHTFRFREQDFVICIDLHREPSGVSPSFASMNSDYSVSSIKTLLPTQLSFIHYATFGLSLIFFMVLRWISTTCNSKLTFERSKKLYGDITIAEALGMQKDELEVKENKLGIDVGKYISGKAERSELKKDTLTGHTNAEKSRTNLRGFELWEVFQYIITTWSILWIRFGSTKTTYVGTISLVYKSDVLPEADWIIFNHLAFPETEAKPLETKLPTILQRNADLYEESLDVPDRITDVPSFLRAPNVPDFVRAVADIKELLAIRQRRAYVRLSIGQLDELYSKAEVKAVMTSGYFEQLLNHGHIDFLLKGKTISRIISFPNQDTTINLTEKARDLLQGLTESYLLSSGSRRLKRVDAPISNESVLPVYDFAILNNSSVIVAHHILKATEIDYASGKQITSTYYVEGYISWRPADIEFYRSLFDRLAGQSKELDLLANKAKVAQERRDKG